MFYKCSPDHVTFLLKTSQRLLLSEQKNHISFRGLQNSINSVWPWLPQFTCWPGHFSSTAGVVVVDVCLVPPICQAASYLRSQAPLALSIAGLFISFRFQLECHHRVAFFSTNGFLCFIYYVTLVLLYEILLDLFLSRLSLRAQLKYGFCNIKSFVLVAALSSVNGGLMNDHVVKSGWLLCPRMSSSHHSAPQSESAEMLQLLLGSLIPN